MLPASALPVGRGGGRMTRPAPPPDLPQANERNGSFYLQSKVYRAKERLEQEFKEQGLPMDDPSAAAGQQQQQQQQQQGGSGAQ